jgi:uncharacterized membrane protein YkvA (DUF1232 family)
MKLGRAALAVWAAALKRHTLTVYYAARDPRTPWPVRLLALAVAAYALSPIDLIPDFIPVLGVLDDLVILPLGLWLVVRLTPAEVVAAARERAERALERPRSRIAAVLVVGLWLLVALVLLRWLIGVLG